MRRKNTIATTPAKVAEIKLPDGILKSDCKYPVFAWSLEEAKKPENNVIDNFSLWYTEKLGWCIPTLGIRNAKRGSQFADRSYGIAINGGGVVSMGMGPHVLRQVEVHVTEARAGALQKYLDLKVSGEKMAGEIRDRISSRRANTQLRRANSSNSPWFL